MSVKVIFSIKSVDPQSNGWTQALPPDALLATLASQAKEGGIKVAGADAQELIDMTPEEEKGILTHTQRSNFEKKLN